MKAKYDKIFTDFWNKNKNTNRMKCHSFTNVK